MKNARVWISTLLVWMLLLSGCANSPSDTSAASSSAAPAASSASPESSAQPKAASESEAAPEAEAASEPVELQIFAAASLTESLTAIQEQYRTVAPQVTLVFNFDSSGTLQTQIEAGAEADLFLSAAQKQMNALEEGGYLVEGTRTDLLVNKVVMIVPQDSDKDIASFEDAATDKVSLIALGNSDVPVGQYSQEIFTSLGLWEAIQAKASMGTNVKEVLAQVENASVDCGVVYATDAATAEGIKIVAEAPAGSHSPVIYPAAVLNTTADAEVAQAFLEYLTGPEATAAFEAVGFTVAA